MMKFITGLLIILACVCALLASPRPTMAQENPTYTFTPIFTRTPMATATQPYTQSTVQFPSGQTFMLEWKASAIGVLIGTLLIGAIAMLILYFTSRELRSWVR